jgi:hypothetical protein
LTEIEIRIDFRANSYAAEDVFDSTQLQNIRTNTTLFYFKESYSIFFGTCFTVCYLKNVTGRTNILYKGYMDLILPNILRRDT